VLAAMAEVFCLRIHADSRGSYAAACRGARRARIAAIRLRIQLGASIANLVGQLAPAPGHARKALVAARNRRYRDFRD
jgi:hypothetical protein